MKRAITGSIALLLAAGVVSAQNAPAPAGAAATTPGASQGASGSMDFGAVDTNKDGRLSSAEVQSHSELRSQFSTLDADRDSYLSQSEYQKWGKAGKSGAAGAAGAPARPGSSSQSTSPNSSSPNSSSSSSSESSSSGADTRSDSSSSSSDSAQ
ncbi:MAG: hypothetical protein M3Y79_11670 [Pseudomonadota bacterium]|nr:hypothetical protein [Pseudomonadota bacterium]